MDKVPTLLDVVRMLAEAGGLGVILSFLFEKSKWFQNLKSEVRFWVVLAVSVGLPILAQVALQYVPADVWTALEPYWHSLALGFIAFVGTQGAHLVNKALKAYSNGS